MKRITNIFKSWVTCASAQDGQAAADALLITQFVLASGMAVFVLVVSTIILLNPTNASDVKETLSPFEEICETGDKEFCHDEDGGE